MSQSRIAIVGKSRSILTWFEDLMDGFRLRGCEVVGISYQAATPAERLSQKGGAGKELYNPEIAKRSAKELAAFSPDLVVVLNKAGLPEPAASIWQESLGGGVPMVGWLCDCLNRVPQDQVPVFDGVYYFDSHCLPFLSQFYGKARAPLRLEYLPLAVNPNRYRFEALDGQNPRVVFAGKCSRHRHRVFKEMRSAGVPLDLYGPGSKNWLKPWRNRRLSSAKIAELYRSYQAVLNLPQPGNTECGMNLRAFEIPAAGGIGTYPDVPDLRLCFEPGREILVYQNAADLARQVCELGSDPERGRAMAAAGYERVIRDHTFEQRAGRILSDWQFR